MLEEGKLRQEVLVHKDPDKIKAVKEFQKKYPPDINTKTGTAQVIRSGKSEIYTRITDEMLAEAVKDEEQLALLRDLGLASVMIVPIYVQKKCIGAITFASSETKRYYSKDDLAIAEEIAIRSGLAIENARLYTETQKALVMRDDFISMASHELKTPITTIKALSQVLERGKSIKTPISKLYLEKINTQIDRLTNLITDLLDVSKIERGRLELIKYAFDFDKFVKEAIAVFAQTVKTHKIFLRGNTHKTIIADNDRINQVISNLLTNAVKYSPKANKVVVSLHTAKDSVSLSIRDYGIGISRKDHGKIFERFYRVIDEKGSSFSGLGIGLYISAQIVERHGGRLTVKSKKGQGSVFTFTLPLDSVRNNKADRKKRLVREARHESKKKH